MTDDDEVSQYAAAVRAALAGLSTAERAHLLDDLEDHLAEAAAESDAPLAVRLGSPEEYAAELRGAYLEGAPTPPRRGRRPSRRWRVAYAAVVLFALLGALGSWQLASRTVNADDWTYTQLTDRVAAGQVGRVEITGSHVVAIDRAGSRHDVTNAPGVDSGLAGALTLAGVDVSYQATPLFGPWLTVVLPNAILLLVVAGLGALLLLARSRRRSSPGYR
ncbi:MAG TPA: hypothetical protein VOB72_25785 [Candidatus Dormibacteraeota bacterium]|nr:hypothetical protein [Candidatus Dormibacteraeota bacterium]